MRYLVLVLVLALLAPVGALAQQDFNPDDYLGEFWYGLYLNKNKSGYSVSRIQKVGDNYVSEEDATFQIAMAGVPQEMRIFSKRTYGPDGALLRIESQVTDAAGASEFNGVVTGDQLLLTSKVGGNVEQVTLPRPEETFRDAVKHAAWVRSKPAVGEKITYKMLEPMYKAELDGESEVIGVEEQVLLGVRTRVYKIRTSIPRLAIESEASVGENGVTLEDVVAGIIRMRLENEELARNTTYSNDVIVANAVMLEEAVANPRTRERLTLILEGPLDKDHAFSDGRQRMLKQDENKYLFVAERQSAEDVNIEFPIDDASKAEWLQPTTFVQSAEPEVIAKAREIVGDEQKAWPAVEKLCTWVSDNVENGFSARLTNALEVLGSLQGDCTEHSILFISFARALGIPAREVAGLVYIEDGPGFYYHQWAKVWVGKWIDVDPTFNQPLADVTHIKLAEGDLFEQAKIMPIIGNLKIAPAPEELAATVKVDERMEDASMKNDPDTPLVPAGAAAATDPNGEPQPGPDPDPLPMPEPEPAPDPDPVPDPEPEPVPNVQ